jgi:ABC-2 type transport system ATP-binding protein
MSLVVLERLTVADAEGPRGLPRGRVASADLFLGPGLHAVLGTPEDGTLALAGALAGERAPLAGRVLVAGHEPSRRAAVRARIGAATARPLLPDAPTVERVVALALAARGASPGAARALLAGFGIGDLAPRRPATLTFAEARAVDVALALSAPAPLLVMVHEPFADVALPDPGLVRARLRELAQAGVCVVVTTSSPGDARSLGDGILLLQAGAFTRAVDGAGVALVPGHAAPLVAYIGVAPGAAAVRELAAALARRPEVREVAFDDARADGQLARLRVAGDDVDACALALAELAAAAGVAVASIGTEPPDLADVRAYRVAPWPWRGHAGGAR